jgi:hypothetical protein
MFQFEGGDVGSTHDLVRRVHVPGSAMGLGVADLFFGPVSLECSFGADNETKVMTGFEWGGVGFGFEGSGHETRHN